MEKVYRRMIWTGSLVTCGLLRWQAEEQSLSHLPHQRSGGKTIQIFTCIAATTTRCWIQRNRLLRMFVEDFRGLDRSQSGPLKLCPLGRLCIVFFEQSDQQCIETLQYDASSSSPDSNRVLPTQWTHLLFTRCRNVQ